MSENQPDSAGPRPSVPDAAIDRAVRQMVQVDPPSGLRRRVQSRLAVPVVPRSAYSMRYLATAAALAMLVLAVGFLRRDNAPQVPTGQGASAGDSGASSASSALPSPAALAEAPAPPPQRGMAPEPDTRSQDARVLPPARAPRAPHTEVIPMPEIVNVFGAPGNTLTGASVSGREGVSRSPLAETPVASPIEITVLSIAPLEIEPLRITQIPAAEKQR